MVIQQKTVGAKCTNVQALNIFTEYSNFDFLMLCRKFMKMCLREYHPAPIIHKFLTQKRKTNVTYNKVICHEHDVILIQNTALI
jgi:hypothetical protein